MAKTGKVVGRDPLAYSAPYIEGVRASAEGRKKNIMEARMRRRLYKIQEAVEKRKALAKKQNEDD